ncbi:TetR/AcrR family transcriptional regulator [Paraconexibacter sp.]|uniref:TetR/AcrR family transcriptional regulator n=1 Tax=Paraconexibacter sp. TaxID=2949640 RepID=UPI0035682C2B
MAEASTTNPGNTVPRGRHAPPLEVRVGVQRERLFEAAARVFSRVGYADASAEGISREAGMSKATFYEHFANKEECLLALFDQAAATIMQAMADEQRANRRESESYNEWIARGVRAFLETLTAHPEASRTLLVEIVGAGPVAMERRDRIFQLFAELLYNDNRAVAPHYAAPQFASIEDAYAIVGAIAALVDRQLRNGLPEDPRDLEPVIERLFFGLLSQAAELDGR